MSGLEVVAYAEVIDGKVVSVRLDKSRHCTEPLVTLTSAQAEKERLGKERDEAWKAAHNAITSCVANWAQDCKSEDERRILSELGKGLADEIATSAPDDWLGIEWLTAKDASQALARAEAAEKERDEWLAVINQVGLDTDQKEWIANFLNRQREPHDAP